MNLAISWCLIPIGIFSWGSLFLRAAGIENRLPQKALMLRLGLGLSVGLIFFSYYWFFSGYVWGYTIISVWIWWILALFGFLLNFSFSKRVCFALRNNNSQKDLLAQRMLTFFCSFGLMVTFARCFSNYIEGDSLVYHLFLPKQFVMQHKIWEIPFSEHLYWPLFSQMNFIPGEILHSLALSKAMTFLIYGTAGFLACGFVSYRTNSTIASLITLSIFFLSPIFFIHAPSNYNDLCYGLLILCSICTLDILNQSPHSSAAKPYFLAGAFLGAAFSTKIIALFAIFGFLALFTVEYPKMSQKQGIRWWAVLLFGCFLFSFVYFLRSYLATGNPVFPYAQKIFHSEAFGYSPPQNLNLIGSSYTQLFSGVGKNLSSLILLPWNLLVRPAVFGGEKVGYLIAGGFLLSFFSFKTGWRFWIMAASYFLVWFYVAQWTRYLTPVFMIFGILAGLGFSNIENRWGRTSRVIITLWIFLCTFHASWAAYHTYKDFFLRGPDLNQQFANQINMKIQPHEKVLVIDGPVYHYNFIAIREKGFRNFTHYPNLSFDKVDALLKKNDIFWVIAAYQPSQDPDAAYDPSTYLSPLLESTQYHLVMSATDAAGKTYRVYQSMSLYNAQNPGRAL